MTQTKRITRTTLIIPEIESIKAFTIIFIFILWEINRSGLRIRNNRIILKTAKSVLVKNKSKSEVITIKKSNYDQKSLRR